MNQDNKTLLKEDFKNQSSFKTFQEVRISKVDSGYFHSD